VVHNANGTTSTFSVVTARPIQTINGVPATTTGLTAALATCDILRLVLGPLDLDLLGLQVHLDRIVLNIIAAAGAGNLISGNQVDGLAIVGAAATGNIVQGNFIGTDLTGMMRLGQGNLNDGLAIEGSSGNAVLNNVISGNVKNGVTIRRLAMSEAVNNRVEGNRIGTDVSGTIDLGNVGDGVAIIAGKSNLIDLNTISGNAGAGVHLFGQPASSSNVQLSGVVPFSLEGSSLHT